MNKAKGGEEAHRKANFQTWVKIADKICDDDDYELEHLNQMDEANKARNQLVYLTKESLSLQCFSMNPMQFLDEPFRVCRPIVFNPAGGFGVDILAGPMGQMNGYRKTLCSNEACKASWMACIKTMTEKFATTFKPGHDSEDAIKKLFTKKMKCYIKLLDL